MADLTAARMVMIPEVTCQREHKLTQHAHAAYILLLTMLHTEGNNYVSAFCSVFPISRMYQIQDFSKQIIYSINKSHNFLSWDPCDGNYRDHCLLGCDAVWRPLDRCNISGEACYLCLQGRSVSAGWYGHRRREQWDWGPSLVPWRWKHQIPLKR